MIMSMTRTISVQEAARITGKTTGRIRQICIALELGEMFHSRLRLLSKRELKQIEKYLADNGREYGPRELAEKV